MTTFRICFLSVACPVARRTPIAPLLRMYFLFRTYKTCVPHRYQARTSKFQQKFLIVVRFFLFLLLLLLNPKTNWTQPRKVSPKHSHRFTGQWVMVLRWLGGGLGSRGELPRDEVAGSAERYEESGQVESPGY
eukprot:GHVU01008449.1.p1 GENE.GHVU01008449.1~~GHVU01008449.1.p1  ORF type:complete len:133 (-),score=6.81 GHVU01008449.1:3-401(-)